VIVFFFLEYVGDLRINILRRKGYRTQTTTHNPTKQPDHTHKKKRKKKKKKLAKDCKHQTASTNKLTDPRAR
jgi:hypothetical protein